MGFGDLAPCPGCGRRFGVWVLPALFRERPLGVVGADTVAPDDASCFFHPQKKAVVPCVECGRFLCALCDAEVEGRHVCPSCFEKAALGHAWVGSAGPRVRYDSIVLSLAILPLLFFPVTVLTAPATVYLVIRHWKRPVSLVPRSRFRFVIAFALAALEILLWLGLVWHFWLR